MHLRCSNPECAATLELHDRALSCPVCADLLEVVVDSVTADSRRTKANVACSGELRTLRWMPAASGAFASFCPSGYSEVVTMAEGNTPLVRGQRAAQWAGVRNLSFKHLGWNPTGCFKDLGMTVGVTEAGFVGAKAVGCASTGNTAASLAAYAARAGLTAKVYLPAGQVSQNKLAQALDFGAEVVQVDGSFDLALDRLLQYARRRNLFPELHQSISPGGTEDGDVRNAGAAWVAGAGLRDCSWRQSRQHFGIRQSICRVASRWVAGESSALRRGAGGRRQSVGANVAFRLGRAATRWSNPETVATAIRIGNPRSWKKAMRAVQHSNGFVMDVTDEEIAEAKAMIGRDGIGCEPASATTLAALRKLTARGEIDRDAVDRCHSHRPRSQGHRFHHQVAAVARSLRQRVARMTTAAALNIASIAAQDAFEIKVPASIANLGPGFDTLAVAVQLVSAADGANHRRDMAGWSSASSTTSFAARTTSSVRFDFWRGKIRFVSLVVRRGAQ